MSTEEIKEVLPAEDEAKKPLGPTEFLFKQSNEAYLRYINIRNNRPKLTNGKMAPPIPPELLVACAIYESAGVLVDAVINLIDQLSMIRIALSPKPKGKPDGNIVVPRMQVK